MLIDTSGWFSSIDERDSRHAVAFSFYRSSSRRFTHSYIIAELVALCDKRRFSRSRTLEFVAELFRDPTVTMIWVDETLTKEAYDLLTNRIDKRWSLCDAVSFVIMKKWGISDALTTDHHFEQAGFVRLLGR